MRFLQHGKPEPKDLGFMKPRLGENSEHPDPSTRHPALVGTRGDPCSLRMTAFSIFVSYWLLITAFQFSPRLRMKAGTSRSSCWKFPLTLLFTCCNEGVSRAGVAAGRSCVPTGATAGAGNGVGRVGVNAETERALEMAAAAAVTCPSRLPA